MSGLHVRFEISPEEFLKELTEAAVRTAGRHGLRESKERLRAAFGKAFKRTIRRTMLVSEQCGSHIIGICKHAMRHEPWSEGAREAMRPSKGE